MNWLAVILGALLCLTGAAVLRLLPKVSADQRSLLRGMAWRGGGATEPWRRGGAARGALRRADASALFEPLESVISLEAAQALNRVSSLKIAKSH